MYLEIDEGFLGHRKTIRFCSLMKNPEAPTLLLRLWTWACRSAPDGDLSGMEPYDIEIAVGYRELDGSCFAALVASRFVDVDAETGRPSRIHNWMERTGGAIARMAQAAEKKRLYRIHKDGDCGGAQSCEFCQKDIAKRAGGQTGNVPGQSTDATKTVVVKSAPAAQDKPTQTRPVQSSPVQTSPEGEGEGAPAPSGFRMPDAGTSVWLRAMYVRLFREYAPSAPEPNTQQWETAVINHLTGWVAVDERQGERAAAFAAKRWAQYEALMRRLLFENARARAKGFPLTWFLTDVASHFANQGKGGAAGDRYAGVSPGMAAKLAARDAEIRAKAAAEAANENHDDEDDSEVA